MRRQAYIGAGHKPRDLFYVKYVFSATQTMILIISSVIVVSCLIVVVVIVVYCRQRRRRRLAAAAGAGQYVVGKSGRYGEMNSGSLVGSSRGRIQRQYDDEDDDTR